MSRLLRLFFLTFGAWIALLTLALVLRHSSVGEVVFANPAAASVYVGLQAALTAIALVMGGWSLLRGPNHDRLVVALPMIALTIYGALLMAGRG